MEALLLSSKGEDVKEGNLTVNTMPRGCNPPCVSKGCCYSERRCARVILTICSISSQRFHQTSSKIISFNKADVATEIWQTFFVHFNHSVPDQGHRGHWSPGWIRPSPLSVPFSPPCSLLPHMFLIKDSRSFTGKMGPGTGKTYDPRQTWAGIEPRTFCTTATDFIHPCSISSRHRSHSRTCREPSYISTAKQLPPTPKYGINTGTSFFTEMYF